MPATTAAPSPDVASLFETAYSRATSGSLVISGTLTIGSVQATFAGTEDFNGLDSRSNLTTTTGGVSINSVELHLGGKRYRQSGIGPWLVDTSPAPTSDLDAQMRAAAADVVDRGTTTRGNSLVHRLLPSSPTALDPADLGLAAGTVSGANSTLTFFAAADGTPAGVAMTINWTQTAGGTADAGHVSLDITFAKLGSRPFLAAPDHVWQVFTSAKAGYSVAYPDDFDHSTNKDFEDFYGPDGLTFAVASRWAVPAQTTLNLTAAWELAGAKKDFNARTGTNTAAELGGQKARLISVSGTVGKRTAIYYEIVTVRGSYAYLLGWLAPASASHPLDEFQTMAATFRFT